VSEEEATDPTNFDPKYDSKRDFNPKKDGEKEFPGQGFSLQNYFYGDGKEPDDKAKK
jgi:hypothetical protein